MGRILLGTAGLVLGTGAAVLAGTGVAAAAQTAGSGAACSQLESTLSSIQSTLPQAASNPSALKSKIGTYAGELKSESASASPAVQSAVGKFISALQAAGSGNVNVSALTADANAIGAACKSSTSSSTPSATPSGAPATGGGSTAGLQDTALIGVGAAAVLAGAGTIAYARRSRVRDHA